MQFLVRSRSCFMKRRDCRSLCKASIVKQQKLKSNWNKLRDWGNVMSGLHTKLPVENSTRLSECEQDEKMPYLPLDQHVPVHVLGRRRHGISSASESPYRSKPRMWRRGAISYERNDAAAEYIRYLGKALVTYTLARTCTHRSVPHCIPLSLDEFDGMH